jgi:hypothetical protein
MSDSIYLCSDNTINEEQRNLIYMGDQVFTHLLNMEQYKHIVIKSVITLFDQYFSWTQNGSPFTTGNFLQKRVSYFHLFHTPSPLLDIQKFAVGYLLSISKISPLLFNG